MTVNSAGKNSKAMHDTFIPMDNLNPALHGKPQSMVYPPGHKDAGKLKGMRDVLEECGLLNTLAHGAQGHPVGLCATCSQSEEACSKAEKAAQEQMRSNPVSIILWRIQALTMTHCQWHKIVHQLVACVDASHCNKTFLMKSHTYR
ncbi:hypothetical protein RSAG8_13956, partial [Rhizoctonia solani AG-8 WAC10335]